MDDRLVREFERIAGPDAVLHEPIQLLTYECDALPHLRERACPSLRVVTALVSRAVRCRFPVES